MTTPPHRRWFQFSLLTMFVVVTVFAVSFGLELNDINRRKVVISRGRENGAMITTRSEWLLIPALGPPPVVRSPFYRRWLGDDPPVEISFPIDGDAECEEELRSEFSDARHASHRRREAP